jgi:BirA family biotin operon repressor/biotin-[acetyl-CoA-carboxylase] ligase
VTAELTLPRLYRAIVIEDCRDDARTEARRIAAGGAEAGTFIWLPDTGRLDCAVVLRPEETGETVLPVVLVAALALSDAIGSVGPPALAVDLVWPGSVRVNGGLVGGIGLDLDIESGLREVPAWAVVRASLRIASESGIEGGEQPDITSLDAEGFVDVGARELAEAFARYFLVWMDRWEDTGLGPVCRHWLHRATARHRDTVLLLGGELIAGTIESLDDTGRLHLETSKGWRKLSIESWWRATG